MWSNEDGMWHASAHGVRKVRGLLEDHVYVIDALLTAYGATAIPGYLRTAEEIMEFTLKHFWDRSGGFVDIAADLHEGVGLPVREVRRRPVEDSRTRGRTQWRPSASSGSTRSPRTTPTGSPPPNSWCRSREKRAGTALCSPARTISPRNRG